MNIKVIKGKMGSGGFAEGMAIVGKQSLCFWGSFDLRTGKIINQWHDLNDVTITGKILVIPSTKGSTANEDMLYYASLLGTGPKAILLNRVDNITISGALIAKIPCLFDFGKDVTSIVKSGDIVTVDVDKRTVTIRCK